MEKLNDFIKKYGLIIFLVTVFIIMISRNTIENMICDLGRPQDNYISSNLNHLIKKLELEPKQVNILNALFDTSKFPQNGYNKDNKSMDNFYINKTNDIITEDKSKKSINRVSYSIEKQGLEPTESIG